MSLNHSCDAFFWIGFASFDIFPDWFHIEGYRNGEFMIRILEISIIILVRNLILGEGSKVKSWRNVEKRRFGGGGLDQGCAPRPAEKGYPAPQKNKKKSCPATLRENWQILRGGVGQSWFELPCAVLPSTPTHFVKQNDGREEKSCKMDNFEIVYKNQTSLERLYIFTGKWQISSKIIILSGLPEFGKFAVLVSKLWWKSLNVAAHIWYRSTHPLLQQ